jgi:hypothetical protein
MAIFILLFVISVTGLFVSIRSHLSERHVILVNLGELGKIEFDGRWDIEEPTPAAAPTPVIARALDAQTPAKAQNTGRRRAA